MRSGFKINRRKAPLPARRIIKTSSSLPREARPGPEVSVGSKRDEMGARAGRAGASGICAAPPPFCPISLGFGGAHRGQILPGADPCWRFFSSGPADAGGAPDVRLHHRRHHRAVRASCAPRGGRGGSHLRRSLPNLWGQGRHGHATLPAPAVPAGFTHPCCLPGEPRGGRDLSGTSTAGCPWCPFGDVPWLWVAGTRPCPPGSQLPAVLVQS